jgi:hypothetical protein
LVLYFFYNHLQASTIQSKIDLFLSILIRGSSSLYYLISHHFNNTKHKCMHTQTHTKMPRVYKHNRRELGAAVRFANSDLADKFAPPQPQLSQKKRALRPDPLKSMPVNHPSPTTAATTALTTSKSFASTRSSMTKGSSNENNKNKNKSSITRVDHEASEKEFLRKCTASAQRMGQYIRLRREQKEIVSILIFRGPTVP